MKTSQLPRHIAVIMDGNGRWAKQKFLPRVAGHKAGVDVVRKIVKASIENNIEVLTLFAFSSENWQRPQQEVSYLMNLFISALEQEAKNLHEQNVQLRFIGDRFRFSEKLCAEISAVEALTQANTGLKLVIAANYGGHWDIVEAMRQLAVEIEQGRITSADISAECIRAKLALADLPEPDLFIRSSGEQRISNFLIWQLAYTELYFSEVLWPDFNVAEFEKALAFYASRERRFGLTSEQLKVSDHA